MLNIIEYIFSGFSISESLIAFGLFLNTIASIIVLIPYLITQVDIEDDLIVSQDSKTGRYTQKKHIKARKIGISGFLLFTFGFGLQLIGLIIQIHSKT